MKAMKAIKAMKAMKAMKISPQLNKKRQVWAGKAKATRGGLRKHDLKKNNKRGKIVYAAVSEKSSCGSLGEVISGSSACTMDTRTLGPWQVACCAARVALHITGFAEIKKNSPFYNKGKKFINNTANLVDTLS